MTPVKLLEQHVKSKLDLVTAHSSRIRGYQREGVQWLLSHELGLMNARMFPDRWEQMPRGGILADEMGLGKTVEMLMAILANPVDGPTLIVVPTNLAYSWEREVKKFLQLPKPPLVVTKITAFEHVTRRIMETKKIVITTHKVVAMAEDTGKTMLSMPFARVVVDESHLLKNPKTNLHKNLMRVKAPIKWCLSGTPVVVGTRDYESQMMFLGVWSSVVTLSNKADKDSFILRRTKKQVTSTGLACHIKLPELHCHTHIIRLPEDSLELKAYNRLYAEGCRFAKDTSGVQDMTVHYDVLATVVQSHPVVIQFEHPDISTAVHPCALVTIGHDTIGVPHWEDPKKQCRLVYDDTQDVFQLTFPESAAPRPLGGITLTEIAIGVPNLLTILNKMRQVLANPALVIPRSVPSLRLRALLKYFDGHPAGTRSLVFCHWREESRRIQHALSKRYPGLKVLEYHGALTSKQKDEVVQTFMGDEPGDIALCIQVNSGGVGLNLQRANRVYINTPHWNPTAEMQAIDRAHRWSNDLGASMPSVIKVIRFVADNTIEAAIHKKYHAKKLAAAAEVLNDDSLRSSAPSADVLTWRDVTKFFDTSNCPESSVDVSSSSTSSDSFITQ